MNTETTPGAVTALPRWDMTPYFPGLETPEFAQAFTHAVDGIDDLVNVFAQVKQPPIDPDTPSPPDVRRTISPAARDFSHGGGEERAGVGSAVLERLLGRWSSLQEELTLIYAYVECFVTTNTLDEAAQARLSELRQRFVRLDQLDSEITAWIGGIDVESATLASETCREHAFMLRQRQTAAAHLMSGPEEDLAAELNASGAAQWGQLHGDVTSQLMVTIEVDGALKQLPMSAVRNLASDPSADVRRRAYEAELAAWDAARVPLAAALNSIKGQVSTLAKRRRWASALDESLFHNHIDRETLDAMMLAARESFPDFRRYLRAKSVLLGHGNVGLPWYDLFAPVAVETRQWSWDDAHAFIVEKFATFSDRLGSFADRAFRERWIDADPRPGKVGGAFCAGTFRDESRILANFDPTFGSVSTLAHELGHGYHNVCLAGRPPLLRTSPMTLAETASIFCETIIRKAATADGTDADRLTILEGALRGACQIVVDISSRFLFEQEVFAARATRNLSPQEFNTLMLQAQDQTYGYGLDPSQRHPAMWAVKGHYYSTYSFYNYPYMFGLLFALGLYARYEQSPDEFRLRYDDLLSSTGAADAATLCARFDIDIRTPDFWRSSLDVIRADIAAFEEIISRAGSLRRINLPSMM